MSVENNSTPLGQLHRENQELIAQARALEEESLRQKEQWDRCLRGMEDLWIQHKKMEKNIREIQDFNGIIDKTADIYQSVKESFFSYWTGTSKTNPQIELTKNTNGKEVRT